MGNIPCSVGILTFNSERTLRRALQSVRDFSEIIVSDGGSTDQTLEIAREFGAKIIEQHAKHEPSPEPRHPIADFSREHNQLLAAATQEWYLRIDSDEYISGELHEEIAAVVQHQEYDGCQLQMYLQSPDGAVTYQLPNPIWQTRLVRRSLGAYQRPIHETFVFNKEPKLKTLKGAWYVPISKPDFATYRWAVNYRLNLLHQGKPPRNFSEYFGRAWYGTLRNSLGITWRIITSYLTISWSKIPPFYYFRNRLYSQWVTFKLVHWLYFSNKNNE